MTRRPCRPQTNPPRAYAGAYARMGAPAPAYARGEWPPRYARSAALGASRSLWRASCQSPRTQGMRQVCGRSARGGRIMSTREPGELWGRYRRSGSGVTSDLLEGDIISLSAEDLLSVAL